MQKRYSDFKKRVDGEATCNAGAIDGNANHRKSFWVNNASICMIAMFIMIVIFRCYIIDRVIISGNSMSSTFNAEDVCWVKKFDYEIDRDDIVIAHINGMNVIKRIAAIPGDSIQIIDGNVYINEKKYSGKYEFETSYEGVAKEKIILDKDEFFLLGDNRDESYDSRHYGTISKRDIKGIVIARIYSNFKIER